MVGDFHRHDKPFAVLFFFFFFFFYILERLSGFLASVREKLCVEPRLRILRGGAGRQSEEMSGFVFEEEETDGMQI